MTIVNTPKQQPQIRARRERITASLVNDFSYFERRRDLRIRTPAATSPSPAEIDAPSISGVVGVRPASKCRWIARINVNTPRP